MRPLAGWLAGGEQAMPGRSRFSPVMVQLRAGLALCSTTSVPGCARLRVRVFRGVNTGPRLHSFLFPPIYHPPYPTPHEAGRVFKGMSPKDRGWPVSHGPGLEGVGRQRPLSLTPLVSLPCSGPPAVPEKALSLHQVPDPRTGTRVFL